MRFDIAKVPVGGMLIGFLLAAIIVTFVAAAVTGAIGYGFSSLTVPIALLCFAKKS